MGEQQHRALMAVARALTQEEQGLILAKSRKWPGMAGAEVADVLDHTVEYDEFLGQTEPFLEEHAIEVGDGYGTAYVLHALVLLGRPLTVEAVRALQQRVRLDAARHSAASQTARAARRKRGGWVVDLDADRHSAAAQTALVLTDGECVTITHAAVDWGFPRESLPARTAEVLDWLVDCPNFAAVYAPFRSFHAAELPDDWYPRFAMTALCALGRHLTMDSVTGLMRRARGGDAPYDPLPDVAHVLFRLRAMGGGYAPSMAVALASLKKGGLVGTEAEIEARLRELTGRQ